MNDFIYEPLLDSSKKFLKLKKVYRWKLKKISEMSDDEIITACHHYVEDNQLTDEWNLFRKENEAFNDDYILDLLNDILNAWTTPIDISDGEFRSEDKFYSYNLAFADWSVQEKIYDNAESKLMHRIIYRILCKQAKENFVNGIYRLDINKMNCREIIEEYKTELKKAK